VHRPLPAGRPGHHHGLVCHRRARRRRHRRPPRPRRVACQQGPAVDRGDARQAPPCPHRCEISRISPRPADIQRHQRHPPGLAGRSGI